MQQSHVRRARRAAIASAAVTTGLLVPSAAHATVTTTSVTTPAPESVFDLGTTALSRGLGDLANVEVKGIAPGAADGDQVAIGCSFSVNGLSVFLPLTGGPTDVEDQAFSDEIIKPPLTCRIRAIAYSDSDDNPFLLSDAELAAFSGPRALGGLNLAETYDDGDSPFDGSDFYINARGQSRGLAATIGFGVPAFTGYSISGGLLATAPTDDTSSRLLFGPSAGLGGFGTFGIGEDTDPTDLANAAIIVDGVPALVYPTTSDDAAKVESRTVDPVTGGVTIVESAPIAKATGTAGSDFVPAPSGVRLERTTVQDHDGRQVTFKDVFRSVDGSAHDIEARYNTSAITAIFDALGEVIDSEDSNLPAELADVLQEPASFRVPWTTGDAYVVPTAGDTFGAAPAGRTTIWLHGPRLDLSALGDLTIPGLTTLTRRAPVARAAARATGDVAPRAEGAVTYDAAPTDGKFLSSGSYVARFVRTVPAGGTTGITQIYSQDLTQEGLKELVDGPTAVDTTPPPPATTPLPTQPAPGPSPAAIKKILDPLPLVAKSTRKILLTAAQGRKLRDRKPVTVTTKGLPAGRYGITIRRWVVGGHTIASGVKTIKKDGDLKVTLRLTRYGRHYLGLKKTRKRSSVKVRVIVTWTPPGKKREKVKTVYTTQFR